MHRHFAVDPTLPMSLSRTGRRLERFEERVDRFSAGTYQRLLFLHGEPVLMSAQQTKPPSRAVIEVDLEGDDVSGRQAERLARDVLERVFGLSIDVRPFYRSFRKDPVLGPLIRRHFGLRVAGRVSLWHTLVQIVLSQQINLKLAHDMLSDLVTAFGRSAEFNGERYYDFPSTQIFAALDVDELRAFRLSRAKATTLIGLARAFETGTLSEEAVAAMDDDAAISYLTEFKGVGRWTAEFTLLRGLSRMDVFPAGDLGVVKYVAERLLGHDSPASEDEMRRFSEAWRPYRGLALIYAYAELG